MFTFFFLIFVFICYSYKEIKDTYLDQRNYIINKDKDSYYIDNNGKYRDSSNREILVFKIINGKRCLTKTNGDIKIILNDSDLIRKQLNQKNKEKNPNYYLYFHKAKSTEDLNDGKPYYITKDGIKYICHFIKGNYGVISIYNDEDHKWYYKTITIAEYKKMKEV